MSTDSSGHPYGPNYIAPNGPFPSFPHSVPPMNVNAAVQPGLHHNIPNPNVPQMQQMQIPMSTMFALMQQQFQPLPNGMPPHFVQPPPAPSPPVDPPKPVLPGPNDDSKLAQVLYEQTERGLTYKAALESLHGFKELAAFVWKDYYLEHKQHIDGLVENLRRSSKPQRNGHGKHVTPPTAGESDNDSARREQRKQTRKAKSIDPPVKLERKRSPVLTLEPKTRGSPRTTDKRSAKKELNTSLRSSRRGTLNSLSVAPGISHLTLVPPEVTIDVEIGLPAVPSRCPSPPSELAPSKNGAHAFTDDDTVFFYKFIAWHLHDNPDLTKSNLCDKLAEAAPHHSSYSWRNFWVRHEDVADKMLLLTQLDEADQEEAIKSWKTGSSMSTSAATDSRNRNGGSSRRPAAQRKNYAELSTDSEELSELESESEYTDADADGEADEDEDAIGSTDDGEELGVSGEVFGNAERRVLAKHIASIPNWSKGDESWGNFFSNYPQRTEKAWKNFYRKKRKELLQLAKKYENRKANEESVSTQRGRPSWASQTSSQGPSSNAKRKYGKNDEDATDKKARVGN